jgi:hypothetical protein
MMRPRGAQLIRSSRLARIGKRTRTGRAAQYDLQRASTDSSRKDIGAERGGPSRKKCAQHHRSKKFIAIASTGQDDVLAASQRPAVYFREPP